MFNNPHKIPENNSQFSGSHKLAQPPLQETEKDRPLTLGWSVRRQRSLPGGNDASEPKRDSEYSREGTGNMPSLVGGVGRRGERALHRTETKVVRLALSLSLAERTSGFHPGSAINALSLWPSPHSAPGVSPLSHWGQKPDGLQACAGV